MAHLILLLFSSLYLVCQVNSSVLGAVYKDITRIWAFGSYCAKELNIPGKEFGEHAEGDVKGMIQGGCLMSCLLKKLEFMDAEGKFHPDAVMAFSGERYSLAKVAEVHRCIENETNEAKKLLVSFTMTDTSVSLPEALICVRGLAVAMCAIE